MEAKKVNKRVKMPTVIQEVTLQEVLTSRRGRRSYSEMGRLCGLSAMTVSRIETGAVALPNRDTLEALSRGYGVAKDTLARAAYGCLFEEVPLVQAVTA